MATKFKIEVASGKKWSDAADVRYDDKNDAVPVAEYIANQRKAQTRVVKVVTKTVWQSKKPELSSS